MHCNFSLVILLLLDVFKCISSACVGDISVSFINLQVSSINILGTAHVPLCCIVKIVSKTEVRKSIYGRSLLRYSGSI